MKRLRSSHLPLLTALAAVSLSVMPASSQTLTAKQNAEPAAAKAANIDVAQRINGETKPTKAAAAAHQTAVETAATVNKLPGAKIEPKDVEPAAQPEIKGFHPIKKLMQPIENLEGMSVKLEQQIMKLEGPISALQPPMINLQHKMTSVDESMTKMQTQLDTVQSQMSGVRSDLKMMRGEISELKAPILSLQKPLQGVSSPLEALEKQLDLVLLSIFIAAVGVVVGTPVAAILIYRYRAKLFPLSPKASASPDKGQEQEEGREREAALR